MKSKYQIVIIGAGTGGITVAAQFFLKNPKLDIAIIDPADKHYYQPAWTLVGAGTYKFKDTERSMSSVMPKKAEWIKEYVSDFNPDANEITLKNGNKIQYDYLVVSPGVQINMGDIKGLQETINKNGVCSNYTDPDYTWKVLQEFKGGTALFTQAATPIKCGGAPQKIMYLADDYFIKHKIKDKTNVTYIMPGGTIFGVPEFKKTLMEVVDRKNIELRYHYKLVEIDGNNKTAYFEIMTPDAKEEELHYHLNNKIETHKEGNRIAVKFDMLHLAPPQSAPDFIRNSPLAHQEGPNKGWISVDKNSMQHTKYKNVFGLGDSAALPTAKTGAAIRKQAPVVVDNILHLIKNEEPTNKDYNGYSSCPLVTGYGKMVLAEFGYENKRMSDPLISKFVDTTKEQYSMWLLKKYGLPFMYWNLMLKGKA